jgi:hypothetical protein
LSPHVNGDTLADQLGVLHEATHWRRPQRLRHARGCAGGAGDHQDHKIYFDSPGNDTGTSKSLNAEWIRLKNTG